MEIPINYIRHIHPWSIVTADISDVVLVFERTIYNKSKKSQHKIIEILDFSQTNISEYIRLCFITYIILGKISPSHVQSIVNEYKLYGSTLTNPTHPTTLKDFLSRLNTRLLDVLDDPMQGVLTRPFHQGLFDNGKTLIDSLEFLNTTHNQSYKELLILYFKLYTKCRQHILDMAFSMARSTPSLKNLEIYSGDEFFSWWRQKWNKEIYINLSEIKRITLFLPDLPEKSIIMITKVIQDISDDYGKLARLLGCPDDVIKDFIQAFVVELNEGMVNLPLNQCGKQQCPTAQKLETSIKSSKGYPTIVPYVKEVSVTGIVLEDIFKRFFLVKNKSFLLPRTQNTIVISQLGNCPFPDYGFTHDGSIP